jgi:uncharacterized protein (DUF1501 family)
MQNIDNIESKQSRRSFLGQASCAAIGSTSILSTLSNFLFTNAAVAQNVASFNDYRALICLYLPGGNDSFNLLVPTGAAYNEYATIRADLKLPDHIPGDPTTILPITPLNNAGRPLALHPGASALKELFDAGKLSFIANIGSLIEPITLAQHQSGYKNPLGLFSHSDQSDQWQTSIPQSRSSIGWAGRLADQLVSANRSSQVSMNISISGYNVWQTGNQVIPYTLGRFGAINYENSRDTGVINFRKQALDSQLAIEYRNVFEKTYSRIKTNAGEAYLEYSAAINNTLPADNMGNNPLADQLRQVAKIIAGRSSLGVKRQTFYVQWGGWDFHDNVLANMETMIPLVSNTLKAFYDLTVAMGVQNNVTTYTASDFGRSLTSNAQGSDHAWGGNQFIMGGAVNGQRIFGQYPDLYAGNPLDTGRGILIPTTSVDQLAAEFAIWMGASKSDLPYILPNIGNFYNINSSANPLGIMI